MCRLNCVGEEKSEYINVGVKKWLEKAVFRCKKVDAKKGYCGASQAYKCELQFGFPLRTYKSPPTLC